MAKWYMTVGVGGGEYASTDEGFLRNEAETLAIDLKQNIVSRPCPPDLADWLDAEMHKWQNCGGGVTRFKVPGGWLYTACETPVSEGALYPTTFIPVPGAAGIKVLEAPSETV